MLIVDLARVLDESNFGKAAAKMLKAQFEAARKKRRTIKESDYAAFDREATIAIEKERARFRQELLQKAQPIIVQIQKSRGADCVLHADALLSYSPAVDITDEVLRLLDA